VLRANDLVVWDAHKDLEAKSWTIDGAEMTKCRRRPDQERLPLWFAAADPDANLANLKRRNPNPTPTDTTV
jgi:hypothetical protein